MSISVVISNTIIIIIIYLFWYKHCILFFYAQHWAEDLEHHRSFSSVQFSRSVVSDSLWPHEPQHTRPPCPSPTPRVYSNSCPLSQWCHPTISSSVVPFSPLPSIFPSTRVFSNESGLPIRWPRYWSFSFSISPSNEYSRLIILKIISMKTSLVIQWLKILLPMQGTWVWSWSGKIPHDKGQLNPHATTT